MKNHFLSYLLVMLFSATAFAQDLQVAFSQANITPEIGVPLGGLGGGGRRVSFLPNVFDFGPNFFLKPSLGVRDPIRAKVLLLKNGNKKLLFISLDVIGVMQEMYGDLLKRLKKIGFNNDEVFISATHTHSGPGSIVNNIFWGVVIMDLYKSHVYKVFAEGIVTAVQKASSNLKEADLFSTSFVAQDIQTNRRSKVGHFDANANILFARDKSGAYLGAMVNLPIHGTALNGRNYNFSADIPGGFERSFEQKLVSMNTLITHAPPPTVLFVNGAEGDVAPKIGGEEAIGKLGEMFANQALDSMENAQKVNPNWNVKIMKAHLGTPGLYIKECFQSKWSKYIYKHFYLGFGMFINREQSLAAIKLGDMVMMTVPGEATTSVGFALKDLASKMGSKQSWVLGLTNGYTAYFTTPSEFDEGSYESCNSLFGRYGADRVLKNMSTLLGGLPKPEL